MECRPPLPICAVREGVEHSCWAVSRETQEEKKCPQPSPGQPTAPPPLHHPPQVLTTTDLQGGPHTHILHHVYHRPTSHRCAGCLPIPDTRRSPMPRAQSLITITRCTSAYFHHPAHTPHTDPPTTGHTQAYVGYTFPEAQVHIRPSPDHSAHPLTPPLLQPDTHTLDSRGETLPQQNMFTHDHITQAKDPPDHHLTLAHPRCREHGLAFTHPQVHYIHPSTSTDPLTTYHPCTPHRAPHSRRSSSWPGLSRGHSGGPSQQEGRPHRPGPHRGGREKGYQRPPPLLFPLLPPPPPSSPGYCCCIADAARAPREPLGRGGGRGLDPGALGPRGCAAE